MNASFLLQEAAKAREAREGEACIAALRQAVEEAEGDELEVAAWRLAHALHDFGRPEEAWEALGVVWEADPVVVHEEGLEVVEPLCRWQWDHVGYGDPRIPALWEAWSRAHLERGRLYLAAKGRTQAAWHYTCRGEVGRVSEVADYARSLSARDLRKDHGERARRLVVDLQGEAADHLLHLGIWSRNEVVARRGYEAAVKAQRARGGDPSFYFLRVAAHAALVFDWVDARAAWVQRHDDALLTLRTNRRAYHVAFGRGLRELAAGRPATAAKRFLKAARIAETKAIGPEWVVCSYVEAIRASRAAGLDPDPAWRAEARRIADQFQVRVFDDVVLTV